MKKLGRKQKPVDVKEEKVMKEDVPVVEAEVVDNAQDEQPKGSPNTVSPDVTGSAPSNGNELTEHEEKHLKDVEESKDKSLTRIDSVMFSTTVEAVKKNLNIKGNFEVTNFGIKGNKVSLCLSNELIDLSITIKDRDRLGI